MPISIDDVSAELTAVKAERDELGADFIKMNDRYHALEKYASEGNFEDLIKTNHESQQEIEKLEFERDEARGRCAKLEKALGEIISEYEVWPSQTGMATIGKAKPLLNAKGPSE